MNTATTMTQISAADVNKLRSMTGAGMMDCKKALTEANGNFDEAVDFLRKKGQKVSSSRAEKETKEGVIFARINENGNEGVLLELNCETDFVARNIDFIKLGEIIVEIALKNVHRTIDEIKLINVDAKQTINDRILDTVGKIGEKIEIRNIKRIQGEKIVSYIHTGSKLGVLVALKNVAGTDISEIGKDVAMQIAAMNPVSIDKDDIDPTIIKREIEIGKEQARNEGKPEQMLEKIALGKLTKFYKESTLLNQDFVKDSSQTVRQILENTKKGLTVSGFVRMALGA